MAKAAKTTAPAKAKAKAAAESDTPKAAKAAAPKAKTTAKTASAKPTSKPAAKPARARAKAAAAKVNKPAAAKAAAAKPAPAPSVARPAAKGLPKAITELTAGLPEKPWLKSYPKNMPAEIGALPYKSIGEFLVGACKQFAARPAFVCMGKSITYAELERLSAAFGAYLQARGLEKGARVALMMPNVLQYPVAMMGILRAGYTVVNVNPLYTPRELEHQLKDSGAQAIVILENFAGTLQAVIARTPVKHVIVAAMGDMLGGLKGAIVNLVVRRVKKMVPAWSLPGHVKFNAVLKTGASIAFKPPAVSGDDIAFLQYTGGTTGISKGATLLHRNVLSNVAQNSLWVEDAYTVKPKPAHLNFICALPLYHIFALTVNALMGMQQGAQNVLIPNPRDIPGFVKELAKYPMHIFPGLNTLFNALLNNEEFRKLDFKPLILTLGGGMAVQKGVAERWKALTGCPVSEGYGLSETSPVATANKFSSSDFTGTIGLPLPSTEIAIRDDDGNNVPLGEVGEVCIRGPQVMAGYWNRPDETAKVMTKDGFFKSGDMGFMDERGYTKIVDRKKDMILVSGFNVYPNELEEVVAHHPGVLEVAAIGVPDEHSGEVPKLFVVRRDPALTIETLMVYCRENLTGYKRPKFIEFRTELPKTPVGKILRRALRDQA
ncbi:long-chain fatty acid--CoA ligase [Mesorhizobium sp. M2D.F.Ca.ET.185.01.1.1]|uniref:long-chain fatty acid--CoA ligase n=1 Tax=unclassified Mesorhizobium TaxID=325217 RepID=UPI000FCC38B4|nr:MULTISPECIES: long-chain fatty acid--CoA ligase [unclassified Mesorhizobium]TGP78142.1 long-chain fatty acid--CoA ligase [bacterium M00.F.Ca.ET.227.01.1.1]TGP88264.1 long-chain fatty acid--CoA ligase [bacterium M00.F.Ca.ET.221.01.1.1]TGP93477.1 long-chain fatty acid--CoA ligase [bacterium M00.F.Ca.ET.222.01.1.1]TGU12950.1 long-chain fatty acid--CoA ligase [bacterium M00.F.Ca.ET.163.01.1.1]TGU31435.1 long-chain fatty acid--CoA ligase [bacterium M00.F.Ca.ET.156.01.1.1]TGU45452.1 long-chain f